MRLAYASMCLAAIPRQAHADPKVVVAEDDHLTARWKPAVEALRKRLSGRTDLDRDARVTILGAGEDALVHVTLPDGRSTVRRAERPEDLLSTVEPLLLALPPPPPRPVEPAKEEAPPPTQPEGLGFEAGVGASAHLTSGPVYFGYGLSGYAQMVKNRWLVGVTTRWEADDVPTGRTLPPGFNRQAFSLGAAVGRRLATGSAILDATLGPRVSVENQEADDGTAEGVGGTYADVSVGAILRTSLPVRPGARGFLAIDAELFPRRTGRPKRIDSALPALPVWGLGLSIGLSWGEQ